MKRRFIVEIKLLSDLDHLYGMNKIVQETMMLGVFQ